MSEDFLKAGERIDQLSSQGIQIIQSSKYFAFSLDAVLLADFVRPNKRHKLKTIDICAGNGAIGLFLNRKLNGHITEAEIQPEIADMASRSIKLNGLEDRYDVMNIDVKDIFDYVDKDSFDIVTCNPPYFKTLPSSQKNPNRYLAIARHELTINLPIVAEKMSGLLKMNGKGYLVHRPERLPEIVRVLEKNRLMVKRIKFAYPKVNKPANIVLIEVIKDGKPGGLIVEPPLIVGDKDGNYTPEVEAMLNDN
ncbi:tRNA1(Val) (adenine(37)-N6)-methyltransferase [Lactobacillus coleohominis]|uniref:tRNA1(Val) (Adenine(37)-N6)-methyltransferase n=2 Tax=Limosilactobacillus coleohominis TaxID=181675 RepID=A0ABS2GXW5_9LACO|nr:tRNA1(Val) (adenine(37)-N6)-methyltransferase [Limosilactobacillus coleohominis]MBM6941130.1 tRNA1(Val) (adenine(37)-N6)-methyltransferase [Limosilactobacillus coleohominis]